MTTTVEPKTPTHGESAESQGASADAAGDRAREQSPLDDESDDRADDEVDDELDDEAGDEADDEADDARETRRAAFLDDLPDAEELKPLIAAFVDGNYALLRQCEQALAKQTTDPEILAAARELVERTEPDPLSKSLLGISVVFFLFIVGWVYLHHAQ
jgi:hypothetical protein